ncbi:hypothetical protein [Persicobacter diffluens]|uniref:Uncharacterized protein n=1 Tax=Persicobacter diffluens TaxID=981 RepID=A0AAN4W2S9_9BACT|nr:hypothetical protein PEDI_40020 [Persicobacter diffluens]
MEALKKETTKELEIRISQEEAAIIFAALGKRPFEEVFELIGKLNLQINEQSAQK